MSHTHSDARLHDIVDVLRGALAAAFGFVLRTGARLAFLLIAGNLYGKELFGALGYAVAVVETIAALSVFGFKRSLFPLLDEAGGADNAAGHRVLASAVVLSITLAVLGAAALTFGWSYVDLPDENEALRLFAWVIPLIALSDVLLSATRYRRKMRYEVASRSIAEPWVLSLLALALYFTHHTDIGLFVAYFAGLAAAAAVAVFGFSKCFDVPAIVRAGPSLTSIRKIVAFSSPTAVVDVIALTFRRIDIFFLWHFTSDGVVGIYHAVQHIASHVQKTRHVFDPILAPVISRTMMTRTPAEAGDQIAQVSRWIFTVMLLQLLVLSAYGGPVLAFVGPGMEAGAMILVVMLVAEVIEGTLASAELPIVYKRPRFNLSLSVAAAGIHITACALLVPLYGGIGAAGALLISLLLVNSARIIAAAHLFQMTIIRPSYIKPAMAGAVSAFAFMLVQQWSVMQSSEAWAIAIGATTIVTAFVLALWALGLSDDDRALLRHLKDGKKRPQE